MSQLKLRLAVLLCCLAGGLAARAETPVNAYITVASVTVTEGNSGQTAFTAQVRVSYVPSGGVTVRVTATPGTADESDYVFTTTDLTFTSANSPQTVTGYVLGDTKPEGDEYFTLSATSTGYFMGSGYGTVTITNDDQALACQLHVEGASVMEGDQGTTYAEVRVLLEPPSTNTVTVAYETVGGTAVATVDFLPASGTLTFAPGETSKTIAIAILGDTTLEPDEYFSVVLSKPDMALLGTPRADVVIATDDPPVHAAIADLAVDEGDEGVKLVPIPITFDRPTPAGGKVQVTTLGAAATTEDFKYLWQTLDVPEGSTQITFNLEVLSDTVPECDEGLFIQYNALYMGDDGTRMAKVLIVDDDGPVANCPDPFSALPHPEPAAEPRGDGGAPPPEPKPVDGGGAAEPPAEPPAADGGGAALPPEPQASDAGGSATNRDAGAGSGLDAGAVSGAITDAQVAPDLGPAPVATEDGAVTDSGGGKLAKSPGCSCTLGASPGRSGLGALALLGLLARRLRRTRVGRRTHT
jgi:hypothetical protein